MKIILSESEEQGKYVFQWHADVDIVSKEVGLARWDCTLDIAEYQEVEEDEINWDEVTFYRFRSVAKEPGEPEVKYPTDEELDAAFAAGITPWEGSPLWTDLFSLKEGEILPCIDGNLLLGEIAAKVSEVPFLVEEDVVKVDFPDYAAEGRITDVLSTDYGRFLVVMWMDEIGASGFFLQNDAYYSPATDGTPSVHAWQSGTSLPARILLVSKE